jgi:hypothetical protein
MSFFRSATLEIRARAIRALRAPCARNNAPRMRISSMLRHARVRERGFSTSQITSLLLDQRDITRADFPEGESSREIMIREAKLCYLKQLEGCILKRLYHPVDISL